MIDAPPSQGWPSRIRKKRDSKLAYHSISRYVDRSIPASATQSSPLELEFADFLHTHDGLANIPKFEQPVHRDPLPDISWLPSATTPYAWPPRPHDPPLQSNGAQFSPYGGGRPLPVNRHDMQFSSQAVSPSEKEEDIISMSESRFGSFDSLDSINSMALSLSGTVASSISDGYAWPVTNSEFNSPTMAEVRDLSLSAGYFQTGPLLDPPYSPNPNDPFPLENDYLNATWVATGDMYEFHPTHLQVNEDAHPSMPPAPSHSPWNVERIPGNHAAGAGGGTFEPARGTPYDIFRAREEYINARQAFPSAFIPEAVSPILDDSDEWEHIASCPSSSPTVHDSPQSDGALWCQIGPSPQSTPSPDQTVRHSHIFSAYSRETSSSKLPRGRQRALTAQQRRAALEVRKAKACWACHLSKIKCSPCSPGSPCQQCERLTGKRRFCHLSCFNDPLESLQTFVMPDYLMGHFTQAKLEEFVSKNATSWGKDEMHIRMTWGYWKPITATVVALTLPSNSRLGYQHQTNVTEDKQVALVRKRSPPLGIPLAALGDMREEYQRLVGDIVKDDLDRYVPISYNDQASSLPQHLLHAICSFYRVGLAAGQECAILREAIEIHVTSTILERSLVLDDDSMRQVEGYLREQYPRRSAANCAQRQIKFALFLVQRQRIFDVLKGWGALMWNSTKGMDAEHKWATSFSVLTILILVVDKTLEAAYFFCENRIAHHGHAAEAERATFEELVRLTQTEVFERCKEIFHTSFKTRKGGKEACNPIRDGLGAFRGRTVPEGISRLVWDLQRVSVEHGNEILAQRKADGWKEGGYKNAGRLAGIFLNEFLE